MSFSERLWPVFILIDYFTYSHSLSVIVVPTPPLVKDLPYLPPKRTTGPLGSPPTRDQRLSHLYPQRLIVIETTLDQTEQ